MDGALGDRARGLCHDHGMSPAQTWARTARLALWPAGFTFGALSLTIARGEPAYSFAGGSTARGAVELLAGWALLVTGFVAWKRRPASRFGALLAAAAFGWFLAEWNNPGIGSALAFALGLTFYAVAAPIVAHAALAYPGGRLASALDRLVIAVAYVGTVVVLGLLPALFFDPAAQGCGDCPRNLLLAHRSPHAYDELNRIGVHAGLVWLLALIVLLAVRFMRSTPPLRRLVWPVLAAAALYLGVIACDFVHSLDRGMLGNDQTDRKLWLVEGVALIALALGVLWGWVSRRRTRAAMAQLVVQLAASPAPGRVRALLAETLDDASLELAYPLSDGRLVDAQGQAVARRPEVTPLTRGGHEIALLLHRPGLLDDPELVEEVASAARLALDNERLQAETRAQLEDLRASRARVIATGDAERRRLERDLHDGAQQQLVGLSLALRLASTRLGPDADPERLARIEEAQSELAAALAQLRDLAHGIFPAVLADEGLAAALEALTEAATIPIEITALPDERLDPAAEAAAYFVVSEIVRQDHATALIVKAAHRDRQLVIEVEGHGPLDQIVGLDDRVVALDGTLTVFHTQDTRVRVRAEIPCGS
jgi:signal transduction histidine kinase